jgi:acetyl-CoA carboxylase biotin carboxyl carrier protein
MDLRKLKTLIDLVSESNVSELEITEAEGKVRIVKSAPQAAVMVAAPPLVAPVAAAAPTPNPVTTTEVVAAAAVETGHEIKSPMVGTFYRAPTPGADAFVDVGSSVKVGDRLCIIEAMKILNEIESDRAGVVKAILANDGDAVEFGQVMFVIE